MGPQVQNRTREHSSKRREREEGLQEYDAIQAASRAVEAGPQLSKQRRLWVTGKRNSGEDRGVVLAVMDRGGKRPIARTDEDEIIDNEGGRFISWHWRSGAGRPPGRFEPPGLQRCAARGFK